MEVASSHQNHTLQTEDDKQPDHHANHTQDDIRDDIVLNPKLFPRLGLKYREFNISCAMFLYHLVGEKHYRGDVN